MGKVRKSSSLTLRPSKGLAKNSVIKNRKAQKKPAEKIAVFKVAIKHICDKCNKKYTTKLGLIRHIKFCVDTSSINRKILNGRKKIITTLSDGRRKSKPILSKNNITLLNGETKHGISNGRIKNITNVLDNHNDLNSQNFNLLPKPVSDRETSLNYDLSDNRKNSYSLFELGENSSDPNSSEEEDINLAVRTPNLNGSCKQNAATGPKVCTCKLIEYLKNIMHEM